MKSLTILRSFMPCRTEALTVELDASLWPFTVFDCAIMAYVTLRIQGVQVWKIHTMNLFSESRSDSTPKVMVTGNGEGDNGSNTVKSRRRAFVGNEKNGVTAIQKCSKFLMLLYKRLQL